MCWSGGKDSALALHALREGAQFDVVALLTTVTRDVDRISMHGIRRELLQRQARSVGLPLDEVWISAGAANEEYETQMEATLGKYRRRGICRVGFGDIFLEDLRAYRERNLARLDMQAVFPLWKRATSELAQNFLDMGFRATTCCIDCRKLGDGFAGREFDSAFLCDLPAEVDPCGESGEFHTFTWSGPIFSCDTPIRTGELVRRDSFLYCDLLPK